MSVSKTKKHIAKEAKHLFSKLGYEKTTMKLLAAEANVNEVTIYRHFGTKDNLLQFITSQYIEEIHVLNRVDLIKDNLPSEVIKTICTWFIDYCFDNEDIYKIQMKMEDNSEGFEKLKLTKNFLNATDYYLNHLKSKNAFSEEPNICAYVLITSILGIFTAYAIDSIYFDKSNVKKAVEIQVELFINRYFI